MKNIAKKIRVSSLGKVTIITVVSVAFLFLGFKILDSVFPEWFVNYSGWQTVSVPGVGKFKIPCEWIVTQTEDVVYITDKPIDAEEYKIYLVGTLTGGKLFVAPYALFDNVQEIDEISCTGLSNGARYGQYEYLVNNKKETKYFLDVGYEKTLYFIAWDNLLDEKTLSKIAKSYVSE